MKLAVIHDTPFRRIQKHLRHVQPAGVQETLAVSSRHRGAVALLRVPPEGSHPISEGLGVATYRGKSFQPLLVTTHSSLLKVRVGT